MLRTTFVNAGWVCGRQVMISRRMLLHDSDDIGAELGC